MRLKDTPLVREFSKKLCDTFQVFDNLDDWYMSKDDDESEFTEYNATLDDRNNLTLDLIEYVIQNATELKQQIKVKYLEKGE